MNTSNTKRLRAATTNLVVLALLALVGAASTRFAIAAQKVSDAELAGQTGEARYFTPGCAGPSTQALCTTNPAFTKTCTRQTGVANGQQNDYYFGIRWDCAACSGTPQAPPYPSPHCDSQSHTVDSVEIRYYSHGSYKHCDDTGTNKNYSGSYWYCPYYDCRDATTIDQTGQHRSS